jgi:hypothetical protein
MSRKRRSGHYCWSCGRMRANEKFSGRGHARHLCKDCARLGEEELAYRQAIRDLERLLTWDGRVPRKNRGQFEKYLHHENERVRAYAHQLEAADAMERAEQRLQQDLEELLGELAAEVDIFPLTVDSSRDLNNEDDTEIPF